MSELTLAPPLLRTDIADYTCEVVAVFVQNFTVTSDIIPVNVFGECSCGVVTVYTLISSQVTVYIYLVKFKFTHLLPVSATTICQLYLRPVSDCLTWVVSSMTSELMDAVYTNAHP